MIQSLIEKSKYLDAKDFLKPVKKKKKKRAKKRKNVAKRTRRISVSEYNRLVAMTKQPPTRNRSLQRQQDDDTPEWAKLAFVSTIPNTRNRN
jgi:hypothetical protein